VRGTWLDPSGRAKAAAGDGLGHAVHFGTAGDVVAAGEVIETMLSLHGMLPARPAPGRPTAAEHLAAMQFPPGLRRLYIVRDNDPAGLRAEAVLIERAQTEGIEVYPDTGVRRLQGRPAAA